MKPILRAMDGIVDFWSIRRRPTGANERTHFLPQACGRVGCPDTVRNWPDTTASFKGESFKNLTKTAS